MKKTMKRIFAIIAVLALCLSLAACGSSGGDEITVLSREEGSGTDRTVQSYMRNMGLADQDLHIVARVDDPEAIKRMTAQGVGVSVLSALSVASEVDDGRLLTFPMDPQGLHRSIYLVYPRETILSQSEQAFVRFCRQMAIRRNL